MHYVDGYVLAVPTDQREAYTRIAETAAQVFLDLGAVQVVETWGDDVPEGKLTSFTMAVQRKPEESVVFSWVAWPSRAARDAGMAKFMEDPRIKAMGPESMPFDGKRMIFGGFQAIVQHPAP